MNELQIAQSKRRIEKALKSKGASNREARIRVARMSVADLEVAGKPTIGERVRRVFAWK